jgi:hypothetical protein
MLGLHTSFAHIRPGDDFFYLGDRFCKIDPSHGEALFTGRILEFEQTVMVTHASNLDLYTADEIVDAQETLACFRP